MADDRTAVDIAELVAEHHAAVYRYAYRLTGAEADAEDLSQQTFLVAQERLGQLRRVEAARGWLFAIVRRLFLRHCRQRRPIPAAALDMDLPDVSDGSPPGTALDEEALQDALNRLSPPLRLAVTMFYFEGATYREIAETLELPMGTVMSRLARAKRALRATLAPPEASTLPSSSPETAQRAPTAAQGNPRARE